MTVQEFSRDIVPLLQLFLSATAILSLLLVWYQIKHTTKWNKLKGLEVFFNRNIEDIELRVREEAQRLGLDLSVLSKELTDDAVNRLLSDAKATACIKRFLNSFEDMCASIRIGCVDQEFAYYLEASRIPRAYRIFKPVIERWRAEDDDDEILIELERVAIDWATRSALRREEDRRILQEKRDNLARAKGAQRKV